MSSAPANEVKVIDEKEEPEDTILALVDSGIEYPTEEEMKTLRRVTDSIPWNAYLIAIVEFAERLSFYGCSAVFTNFIQQPLPLNSHTGAGFKNGQSGALGLGQRASMGLTTFYQFWCYVTPLLGAYIADTHLGRFKTVCLAVLIALIGHILLIIPALPGVIEHKSAIVPFIIALIVMGLGTGLFKANISPLVAEQYRGDRPFIRVMRKTGERVIVDPALTVASIYMYFYLFINIGALVGRIGMTYSEKYVGFWLSFTLPTIIFLLCPIVLYLGRDRYVHSPPTGSILSRVFKLWRYAMRNRWSWNPIKLWKNVTADDFWENAKPSKIITKNGEGKPKWMNNFDDNWVMQVRRAFKACGVFCWYPLYWIAYNQLSSNLTSQAAVLTTNGLPNDVLANLDPLALIIFIPICDLLIYPALRGFGINFSPLKKITFGFFTGSAAMIWAAVVQHYIYKTSPCGYSAATCRGPNKQALVSPLIVWIQTGSYVLVAFSEIFASITGLEYAFTKAPKNMRSLVMSLFLFTSALSAAIGEAFIPLSADPLLVWNYGVVAVLATVSGLVFWISVRKLDADEDKLNALNHQAE